MLRIERVLLGVVIVTACGTPKADRPPRFIFESDIPEVEIMVGDQPIKLEKSGYDATVRGMIDMPKGTKAGTIQPSISLPTACIPAPHISIDRRPPNASNVIIIKISKYEVPKSFDVVVAPGLPAVRVGGYTIPAGTRRVTLYGRECNFDVKIGAQTIAMLNPVNGVETLFVGGDATKCFVTGVTTWARSGATCAKDRKTQLQGALAYWIDQPMYYAFENLPVTIETYRDACDYRAYVNGC